MKLLLNGHIDCGRSLIFATNEAGKRHRTCFHEIILAASHASLTTHWLCMRRVLFTLLIDRHTLCYTRFIVDYSV